MAVFRPGGLKLTEEAVRICSFSPEARLLDVGCGTGDTVEFLVNQGYQAEGLDRSEALIKKGLERNPGLKLKKGEADFLDEFTSFTFDGVFMECTLSLLKMQTEALHEAYCVLKKGGKLVISDVFLQNPDPKRVQEQVALSLRAQNTSKQEGECESEEKSGLPSEYCIDGALIPELLAKKMTEEIGFKNVRFFDKSKALRDFYAQTIMDYGSMEEFFRQEGKEEPPCSFCRGAKQKGLGYFLMVADKPE